MKRRTFVTSALALGASAGALPRPLWAATTAAPAGAGTASAPELPFVRSDGKQGVLTAAEVAELRGSLGGTLLTASDDGYDATRRIWNGAFDRKPALIARCAGAADVTEAVDFARTHSMLVAVRGGGHSLSGQSVCDGGIMIDLAGMRGLRVDPESRSAWVQPGVLLGAFDREAQFYGLATTAGTVSHTGAAGLTLGGGFGRIARRFALACDNLKAADVVTASGKLVKTTELENPDLLWGLRGGGGNFGIVTSFQYQLHKVDPMMYGGRLLFNAKDAREILGFFAGYAAEAPDELCADCGLGTSEKFGPYLGFDICYSGPLSSAEKVLAPLRTIRKPLVDALGPAPYVKLQSSGDDSNAPGACYYERSGFLKQLNAAVIDAVVSIMEQPHPADAEMAFVHHGGAIARVKPEATAFWHRDAKHTLLVDIGWNGPHNEKARDEALHWARENWKAVEKLTDGFYVNTVALDDPHQRIRATYGANYDRLVALKDKFDPTNLFHMNANVPPSKSPA